MCLPSINLSTKDGDWTNTEAAQSATAQVSAPHQTQQTLQLRCPQKSLALGLSSILSSILSFIFSSILSSF